MVDIEWARNLQRRLSAFGKNRLVRHSAPALWRDASGVAAVEFALSIPLLLILFFAILEFDRYLMLERRGEQAVFFAAEYLSRDNDNLMSQAEHETWQDVWMLVRPQSFHGMNMETPPEPTPQKGGGKSQKNADSEPVTTVAGVSRWAASVDFQIDSGCTTSPCAYLPDPIWSAGQQSSETGNVARACELTVVDNDVDISPDTLPMGETGSAPIVIVDMVFPYAPVVPNPLLSNMDIRATAIRSMRSGLPLNADPDSTTLQAALCP